MYEPSVNESDDISYKHDITKESSIDTDIIINSLNIKDKSDIPENYNKSSLPLFERSKATPETIQLGNTSGNRMNKGMMWEHNGWIYYDYNNAASYVNQSWMVTKILQIRKHIITNSD